MDFGRYVNTFLSGYRDYAGYVYHEITSLSWTNYFYWLIGISLFFFFLEYFRPWRKEQGALKKDFWLDIFYMFFNFFIFSLIGYHAVSSVFVEAFNDFLAGTFHIRNLVAIEIGGWPIWLQLLAMFIIRDFIQWNVHRLMHSVPFLWKFHKVHHSAKQLGFATHLRFHWMETIVYRVIEYIPLGMIGFGIQEFFLVHIIALSIGHFNHSNIIIPLGFFKYIFNNPQMHTWHHAKQYPSNFRYGINYGLSLSVWDYLFGTVYFPDSGEHVELGYPGEEEMPQSFLGQATFPLSKKSRNN